MNNKIECIVICKNYSDYLEITLPINKKYFDNIIVVTDEFDGRTHKVCEDNGVESVIYDGFNKNGAAFNFAGARREGLKHLKYSDSWVVFMDADIEILEDFRDKLNNPLLFYGSFRRFIPSYKDYKDLKENKVTKDSFSAIKGEGCGYWQGFSQNHPLVKTIGVTNVYQEWSYSAEECDINCLKLFCQFDLITNKYFGLVDLNIELLHLGNQPGLNNSGRSEDDAFFK